MPDLPSIFQEYTDRKIAVYGLSVETEKLLPELDRMFQVIGLLDGYLEEGILYGKPIISMLQAIESSVDMILVVARPGSCRVIAKRIGRLCLENEIALLDIKGKDLCRPQNVVYDMEDIQGFTKEQLFQMVQDKEAVSFDLFDTLIMRQVLFPSDVFGLIDRRLKKQGIHIEDFCGKRLESEKNLSREGAPFLIEIYKYMVDTYCIEEIDPEGLAQIEWDIDHDLLVPRQEMCRFVSEIVDAGKDVYIVSDTYFTKQQIIQLLDKCKIYGYKDILASCEYRTGKVQHLFEKFKGMLSGRTCIHIGDDIVADVEAAQRNGLMACQIYSGVEFLSKVGYIGLWDHLGGISDRVKAGMFVARFFNNPFQFEGADKKFYVRDLYDIGYLFFAPMITDFVLWFREQIKKYNIQNIFFCARDGYLIKKLYDELTDDMSSVYFLTSRVAAIRAGIESEVDIGDVEEMNFSGSIDEQLEKRFGIFSHAKHTGDKLTDHTQEILDITEINRKNYKVYIDSLDIKDGDIAFFDFVAKGTSQSYIGRLIKNHLKGLYFLHLKDGGMRESDLDILSFYEKDEMIDSTLFEDYYILEAILTSPMPSVIGFDEHGRVRYDEETRKKEDLECFQAVQNGIIDYFMEYIDICPHDEMKIDKKIDEVFLDLIHKISILDEGFLRLMVDDPFFNRTTCMMDLI